MHHFGFGTQNLSHWIAEPCLCGLHCLQSLIYHYFHRRSLLHFFFTWQYPFHLFLKISRWAGECWCVHVQSKIRDQSSPRVICIHTTLYGNKIKFLFALTPATHAAIDPLRICRLECWELCEHYGLYGGCHVMSPLDYYNREEMTLTRHGADPQHNYIYTTQRRSPDSKESRAQLVQTSVISLHKKEWNHLHWSILVTPWSGNADIKCSLITQILPPPPDTGPRHGASPSQQSRLRPGYKGN